ncbi:trypsin-like peptidase domain-containing protein [Couchioplanes caeruleus]|uniref:trypsin-like peptidase domain-containing protein n=1 Tax=Couchioplanes caeruleus TaxID=56438 RepID=UPI0020BE9C7F|nr:trypsin-like peptidase domain-containing protein [Couchioplanes caeruleus]UQU65978.1 trypsin-like peptidase domain-containing protein [Couchioplanes caeruleus]
MNEPETNPQRHEDSSPEEQSHRSADASPAGSSPERGESDTTAQQPVVSGGPAPWQPTQPPAQQPAQPQAAQPHPGQPQHQPGQWPASPWQSGGQPPYGQQPYPGQPFPPHPGQHPGAPQPAYAGAYQGQPGQPPVQPGQPQHGQPPVQPGQPPYGQPGTEGPWTAQQAADAPIWATQVGGEPHRDPARAGRSRRILVAGAAALVIALGAGGVGAATALAFHDDNNTGTVQTTKSAVTSVIDRSSLAQIVAAVKDSVVSIKTESGEGSGVVLDTQGYIVTNNHVVATAQGDTVTVIFASGKKASATITGTDPRTDLAVVKVSGVSDLKPAKFGSSADMQVGDTVLALGSPLGLEGSVTEGIISAKDRTIRSGGEDQQTPQNPFGGGQQQEQPSATTSMSGLLQTDAPINPGNSGGALVNTNGEVIGINSAIATSGSSSGNIGLGFAIPSDKVTTVSKALMKGEKVSHPALGVSVTEAEGGGAVVSAVNPGSAAAKAGIEQGDVITAVNGKTVDDSDDLIAAIQSGKVGDSVSVKFTRNGQEQTVNATLTEAS